MPKSILILCPFFPPNIGGAETFAEGLAEHLSKDNYVTVLAFKSFEGKGGSYSYKMNDVGDLEVMRMKWPFRMGKAWRGVGLGNFFAIVPKMLWESIRVCRVRKVDIVFCNGLCGGFIGAMLKVLFKVEARCILLALYDFRAGAVFSNLARGVLRRMDKIFVEGENGKRDIAPLGISGFKIKEFQHWVDQDVFKPLGDRDNGRLMVLFIGRPIPEKGMFIVKYAEKELDGRVDFEYIENVPHQDLARHYQMADVLVVPSLYSEGFVRVVAEASSCGCCIVVSQYGSLPDMVKGFGIEFDAGNYKSLAFLINGLDENRIMLVNHQHLALEYAKKNFNKSNAGVFLSI